MKKRLFLSIILVLMLLILSLSCFLLTGCKSKETITTYAYVNDGETDISIGILADIHVMAETQAVDMTCADFKAWEAHGQKMLGLSESILKTAVDRIIAESDFDVVLVSGDNADDGGEVTHRAVAAELKRLENAGIKVFTIPGNHDINNNSYAYAGGKAALTNPTSETEFAAIYKDFGYNGTDVIEYFKNAGTDDLKNTEFSEGDNLSYVADLSDKYRLIAIDMCKYAETGFLLDENGNVVLYDGEPYPTVSNRHDGNMTAALLLWAEEKTKQAIEEGKTPIGMMHFPLIQHFGPLVNAENGAVNDPNGYVVADVLADAGMRYIFTGHIHIQDDALYTSGNGNKILDINSASLCNYPTPIRYFRAKGDEVFVRTWHMDRINESYLPRYLSSEEKSEILSDFRKYSVDYIDGSMLAKIKNKVDMDTMHTLLKKLGISRNGTNDAAVMELATAMYEDIFLKFLNMPLYKTKGQTSVESIAKSYGKKLPSTDYTTVFDLAMSYVVGMYGGDESASLQEKRATVLKYAIYSAFQIIADFDLFGRLHALNANIPQISLKATVKSLFETGTLDVCENGLLSGEFIASLNISALKKLRIGKNADPYDTLSQLRDAAKDFGLESLLFGIDISEYITCMKSAKFGYIDLGALYDDVVFGKLTLGLINDSLSSGNVYDYRDGQTDSAPADNNLKINTKTMAYSTLD